jgi:hypothetical protein
MLRMVPSCYHQTLSMLQSILLSCAPGKRMHALQDAVCGDAPHSTKPTQQLAYYLGISNVQSCECSRSIGHSNGVQCWWRLSADIKLTRVDQLNIS